jgi:hypothetical protein
VDIPTDISGSFGKFDWGGVYSSSSKLTGCALGTNGFYYFFRSTSSNPSCNFWISILRLQHILPLLWFRSRIWKSGGVMAASGSMYLQVCKRLLLNQIHSAPEDSDHNEMRDSHSRDRTFSFTIADDGEPPSGLEDISS